MGKEGNVPIYKVHANKANLPVIYNVNGCFFTKLVNINDRYSPISCRLSPYSSMTATAAMQSLGIKYI